MRYSAFRRSLLHLLQTRAFEQWLGCQGDRCARVEFQLSAIYTIHVRRRRVVLEERERELIRRAEKRRWRAVGPALTHSRRIVLDRATGKILQASPPTGPQHPATLPGLSRVFRPAHGDRVSRRSCEKIPMGTE